MNSVPHIKCRSGEQRQLLTLIVDAKALEFHNSLCLSFLGPFCLSHHLRESDSARLVLVEPSTNPANSHGRCPGDKGVFLGGRTPFQRLN